MKRARAALSAILLLLLANPASAVITATYQELSAFQTATGSVSVSGAIPNLGKVGTDPVVVGDVTLDSTSGDLYLGTLGLGSSWSGGWSSKIAGHEIAISGTEDFDITVNLAGGVTAFGFEIHEPSDSKESTDGCNATCVDSTFTISLFNGAISVGSTTVNVNDDVLAFFGLVSDAVFDTVKIVETTGGLENEYFGQFYANPRSVSEPGSLALLGASVLGLLAMRGRRRR